MTVVMIGQKGLPARSGGIERHVSLLASGLASRGHKVIVYGRKWYVVNGEAPAGVIQKFTWGIRSKHLDAITHSLTALFAARRERPDIVHIQGSGIEILTPLARLLFPKAKIVFTFHCHNHVLAKWNWFARFCLRLSERVGCLFAHRTVVISQTLASYCLTMYGCQATYIPYSMTIAENPSQDSLAEHGLFPEQYLLFVGRLIPDKQAHTLVEAYRVARDRRPELFQDVPLVLVGGAAWTGSYAQWLSSMAAKVPGVMMLGERTGSELHAIQAHALGHVFPTLSEGMSLAILEACAYARPVIATGIPQNIEATGGHGITVNLKDIQDLARGLIELLERSHEDRKAMGTRLQTHVRRLCDLSDRMDDVSRVYREVLTGDQSLTSPITEPVRP